VILDMLSRPVRCAGVHSAPADIATRADAARGARARFSFVCSDVCFRCGRSHTGSPARPLPVGPVAVTPLSPDRYKFQLTIGGDTLEKLRLAKDMLGHAIPSGDDATILDGR